MESKLKNTILPIKRYQRHLKLAFIVADDEVSTTIPAILNWCSFNVRGPGSLIFSLKSLDESINKSLLRENSPDFLVNVGNVPEATIKKLENDYQPFGTWDWKELSGYLDDDYTNLPNMLKYRNFPQKCLISSNTKNSFSLLSMVLFGYLSNSQKEQIKSYLELTDVDINSGDFDFLKHQNYGGGGNKLSSNAILA